MKTVIKDARIILSRNGQVLTEGDLRKTILATFLLHSSKDLNSDFEKETLVILKINLGGEDFVFELPANP